jgi:hypothetical protein
MDRDATLEREYELERRNGSSHAEDELEDTDQDTASELEGQDGLEQEFEALRGEADYEADEAEGSFGERFYELSLRESEAEWELEQRVGEVLDDIEREYFFGGLSKLAKKIGKSGLVRGLASKAFKLVKDRVPVLQAIEGVTQLARGNLRGALGSMARTALSAHPAGAAALQGLRAFGFQGEADDPENREAWQRFAEFAQEAYEELAQRTTMEIDNPIVAADTAHAALKAAMARTFGNGVAPSGTRPRSRGRRQVRKISLGPNELIVIRAR